MAQLQQGDVLLFQTNDDGEINVENGIVEMSGGLESAAYLSLFGGNEQDDGRLGSEETWWGNVIEPVLTRRQRSETQYLLRSLPLTSFNLPRVQDAATRDLAWFLTDNVASSVTVLASIPKANTLNLIITIEAKGEESRFEFTQNWKAAL